MTDFWGYHWANSWALFLLILVPPLLWRKWRARKELRMTAPSLVLLGDLKKSWRQRTEFLPYIFYGVALMAIIFALARPQTLNVFNVTHAEGVDMLLTLDVSLSMNGLDMELNGKTVPRLEVLKNVVADFVKRRKNDQMGMIVFGEQAYTQCPLTFDTNILLGYLEMLEVGMAGNGTAIGKALAMSVKRLQDSKAKSRVVVFVSDGENTIPEVQPLNAAELAAKYKIRVYTIGVGSQMELVPLLVPTPFGDRIQRQPLPMDEETLQEIAKITGGKYFRATSTEALRDIYRTIDELEKTKVEQERFTDVEENFYPLVFIAWMALLFEFLLVRFIYRRLP